MKKIVSAFVTLAFSTVLASAENIALVISNSEYQYTIDLDAASVLSETEAAFADAGFETIAIQNVTKAQLQNALRDVASRASGIDRLVVVYGGHALNTDNDTFLTPVDLRDPSARTIGTNAVSVARLLDLLAQFPGGAMLAVGTGQSAGDFFSSDERGFEGADGLNSGLADLDLPQGVTLLEGAPGDVAEALTEAFLSAPSLSDASEQITSDVRVSGFLSKFVGLSALEPADDVTLEDAYWAIAKNDDTLEAYETYIENFPEGENSELASARIAEIKDGQPQYSPEEQAERDLALTRDERRDVQRNLTILDHDPRGIDGLFGPATRGAISSWQRANFFDVTGFLDANQVRSLREQGQERAEELEREAERQAAIRREQDVAFWQQTGVSGQESDLRAYLREFPDGVYSDDAQAALDQIEAEKLQAASAQERDDWAEVAGVNTPEAYRAYLETYPNGLFKDEAETRISQLSVSEQDAAKIEAAKKREDALNLNASAWQIVEGKLSQLGLKPGKADGKVNDKTRKAIRNYQQNAGLDVTGYLDRETFSRLLLTFKL